MPEIQARLPQPPAGDSQGRQLLLILVLRSLPAAAKKIHGRDLSEGIGRVDLPNALARKYPAADRQR